MKDINISHCRCSTCGLLSKTEPVCANEKAYRPHVEHAIREFRKDDQTLRIMRAHSTLLGRGSSKWPRIRQLMELAHAGKFHRIGIAACAAFIPQAAWLRNYFDENGLEAIVSCCRMGRLDLKDLGIHRTLDYDYVACNPVAQAALCNEFSTEFNILLGLCPGHDMIFTIHAQAPTTTLFVKEYISHHSPFVTIEALRKQP